MNKKHVLIGAAIGMGAQNPASEMGPVFLQNNKLTQYLHTKNTWKGIIHTREFSTKLESLIDFMNQLKNSTYESITEHQFPIVLGGDHSCAIGTWGGVVNALKTENNQNEMGLIWVDAHLDSHTFETSLSQAIHGMPLAVLLGHGGEELLNISGNSSRIKPQNTVVIGARSWESGERALLDSLGVRIIEMKEVNQIGIEKALEQAYNIVSHNTTHFGVTIDLDVFDPTLAPGVCSKENDGLNHEEFLKAIYSTQIFHDNKLCALEIVEFAPSEDKNNQTFNIIIDLLNEL
jgi:arginase